MLRSPPPSSVDSAPSPSTLLQDLNLQSDDLQRYLLCTTFTRRRTHTSVLYTHLIISPAVLVAAGSLPLSDGAVNMSVTDEEDFLNALDQSDLDATRRPAESAQFVVPVAPATPSVPAVQPPMAAPSHVVQHSPPAQSPKPMAAVFNKKKKNTTPVIRAKPAEKRGRPHKLKIGPGTDVVSGAAPQDLESPMKRPRTATSTPVVGHAERVAVGAAMVVKPVAADAPAASSEIVVAAPVDTSSICLQMQSTNDRVLALLEDQKTKTDKFFNELLVNKTAIAEVHAHSEGVELRVDQIDERMEKIAIAHAKLDDKVERDRRCKDVIVRGISLVGSESENELLNMVDVIAKAVGCRLLRRDVEYARVLQSRETDEAAHYTSRMLLVRFSTPAVRRAFFNCYMRVVKGDGIRASCLGGSNDTRLFISDNLTGRNAAIRRRAIALVREGHLQLTKVRDGLVYVAVNGDNQLIPIFTLDELDDLLGQRPLARPSGSNINAGHRGLANSRPTGQRGGGRGRGRGGSRSPAGSNAPLSGGGALPISQVRGRGGTRSPAGPTALNSGGGALDWNRSPISPLGAAIRSSGGGTPHHNQSNRGNNNGQRGGRGRGGPSGFFSRRR